MLAPPWAATPRARHGAAGAAGVAAAAQVQEDVARPGHDEGLVVVGDLPPHQVAGRQDQGRDHQRVQHAGRPERRLLRLGQLAGLVLVPGQEPLVEADLPPDDLVVAQQHRQELQVRDVPAEHRERHGERRREGQPHRPPEPGPEERRHQERDRRDAGAAPDEERLDGVAGHEVHAEEEPHREDQRAPAREEREGQRGGREHRRHRPEVGDEPGHGGHAAPERRVRDAHEEEPGADHQAEEPVDHRLDQQVAGDPLARRRPACGWSR